MEEPSERNNEVRETSERERGSDSPPSDDFCPICRDTFFVPSRTQCGHWYCAGCILQYWNHCAVHQPCKCPMCLRPISKLTLVTSMHHRQEERVTKILENIWKYNRLFGGGTNGLIHKVLVLPLTIKRIFQDRMDPDRALHLLHKACFVAISLGALYSFCFFDFLKKGHLCAIGFFDYCAIALVVIVYLTGLCRIRRLQHMGRLAAIQF